MKKKALLILNGEIKNKSLLRKLVKSNDLIIATDGSYDKIAKLNIVPDIIMGDLDSISSIPKNIRIIKETNQNESDFEKALIWLKKNNYSEISIVGITGGRTDHLFINFALIYKYYQVLNLTIYANNEIIRILTPDKYMINGEKNDLFSILALPKAKNLIIKGAKYSINEKEFEIGSQGLSNEFLSNTIEISFTSGLIAFIRSH
ncbi:MAG: thiamine diphosphokinase [Candidatus Marinimicrobia bacterium]|jgi:thiamine pyrophosphokinase|nr:thiamine diphosphokinase [Candidatus Neomarinimicrobiota bacterium]